MLDRLTKLREERANSDKGFTLIELLVVVVIIGILIAIAIPLYLNYTNSAKQKSAEADVRTSLAALEQCNSDNNAYPTGTATRLAGCPNFTKLNVSTGNTAYYFPNVVSNIATGYLVEAKSTDGKFFCYTTGTGGSVKLAASQVAPTQYTATC